jgi:hypothetical protein
VKPEYANRTSYVIAPGGKIIYEYTALNPDKHVENTMNAVQQWVARRSIERARRARISRYRILGSNLSATPFMQKRSPVGLGPSRNT